MRVTQEGNCEDWARSKMERWKDVVWDTVDQKQSSPVAIERGQQWVCARYGQQLSLANTRREKGRPKLKKVKLVGSCMRLMIYIDTGERLTIYLDIPLAVKRLGSLLSLSNSFFVCHSTRQVCCRQQHSNKIKTWTRYRDKDILAKKVTIMCGREAMQPIYQSLSNYLFYWKASYITDCVLEISIRYRLRFLGMI